MSETPWAYRVEHWPGVVGGFSARGPVTDPADPQSGFNLGHTPTADPVAVAARRAALQVDLGLPDDAVVQAEQVHGREVAVVTRADLDRLPRRHDCPTVPGVDGLATAEPGLALRLFYADCCPVCLYSPQVPALAVLHAGWRGSVADIAGEGVRVLAATWDVAPTELQAIIGPCIGPECYPVGEEVIAAVTALGLPTTLPRHAGQTCLNLQALNRALLQRAGLPPAQITTVPLCTSCGPVALYSWRRDGPQTGRQVAVMALWGNEGEA
jgi:hypothetical protein